MNKVNACCIIDDDPIFIYGTKRIMRQLNFSDNIMVFHNGQDAIAGISKLNRPEQLLPDVIFLDLNMPIMDGWGFLDEFEKLSDHNLNKIVIYIISSSEDPRDLERVKSHRQVSNYILKPITPNDLEAVLTAINV